MLNTHPTENATKTGRSRREGRFMNTLSHSNGDDSNVGRVRVVNSRIQLYNPRSEKERGKARVETVGRKGHQGNELGKRKGKKNNKRPFERGKCSKTRGRACLPYKSRGGPGRGRGIQ